MNYIRHLHAFYHHVKRDNRLTSSHISLYLALFQYWNYNRFQNNFSVSRDELMKLSKIGSKNTYHKCIKELQSFGYILHHLSVTKYLPPRISMMRLGMGDDEKNFAQLNLFDIDGNQVNKPSFSTNLDTRPVTFSSFTNPNIDTTPVPILTATGINFDTASVPILIHNIKHKQVNNKQVCVNNNTHTKIFNKNSFIEKAINNLAAAPSIKQQKQQFRSTINPILVPQKKVSPVVEMASITLAMVEAYFTKNDTPITEAQKFYYYNQGRGWMLSNMLPIKDWQALAQKWMLNNLQPKYFSNVTNRQQQNNPIDPGPNKNYSEPL